MHPLTFQSSHFLRCHNQKAFAICWHRGIEPSSPSCEPACLYSSQVIHLGTPAQNEVRHCICLLVLVQRCTWDSWWQAEVACCSHSPGAHVHVTYIGPGLLLIMTNGRWPCWKHMQEPLVTCWVRKWRRVSETTPCGYMLSHLRLSH